MHIHSHHTDIELLQLLKAGRESAFTEIYHRYWDRLFAIAVARIQDPDEAEEIVQEIFVSLWRRREELEITSGLSVYLAVSVKYRVIKILAKLHQQRKYKDSLDAMTLVDDSTQEWLEFEELKERLSKLVADLPEKCQLVYRYSREKGYTQKQIAEELNISEKTVEAHLSKAMKTLRAGLNQVFFSFFL
ncbi:RNA polymerase sigma-70 factor [Chitinophaga sp. MM2321]|uniref:RNA polymerase sigma-70 factor n=1 Tax=Chitinophaga sp. MM2321 TaxID=3137178 RepID=UPI0032D5909E